MPDWSHLEAESMTRSVYSGKCVRVGDGDIFFPEYGQRVAIFSPDGDKKYNPFAIFIGLSETCENVFVSLDEYNNIRFYECHISMCRKSNEFKGLPIVIASPVNGSFPLEFFYNRIRFHLARQPLKE
jgi:hypothetical protein